MNTKNFFKRTFNKNHIGESGKREHVDLQTIVNTQSTAPALNQADMRVWNEFVTGMQMFNKYVRRMNADARQIIRANLRLLHANLLATATYKELITTTKRASGAHFLLSRYPIIKNDNVQGALIRMNHSSDTLHGKHIAARICSMGSFGGTEPAMSLFIVVAGKLSVTYNDDLDGFVDYQDSSRHTGIVKSGDVLINPQHQRTIQSISSNQKSTLLLAIQFASEANEQLGELQKGKSAA